MTKEEFIRDVEEFVSYYCSDYMEKGTWKMTNEEEDDFEAEVEVTLMNGHKYTVPIGIDRTQKEHTVAIAAHPDYDTYLSLDGEGLYTWLFFEADKELEKREKNES